MYTKSRYINFGCSARNAESVHISQVEPFFRFLPLIVMADGDDKGPGIAGIALASSILEVSARFMLRCIDITAGRTLLALPFFMTAEEPLALGWCEAMY